MSDTAKPCLAGCGNLIRMDGMGPKHFAAKQYCSRTCSAAHRKIRPGGDHDTTRSSQSRERAVRAMKKNWDIRKAIAAARAAPIPLRPSRQVEEDAIARFVAERGVTRVEPVIGESPPSRQETHRPQPMAGWRG